MSIKLKLLLVLVLLSTGFVGATTTVSNNYTCDWNASLVCYVNSIQAVDDDSFIWNEGNNNTGIAAQVNYSLRFISNNTNVSLSTTDPDLFTRNMHSGQVVEVGNKYYYARIDTGTGWHINQYDIASSTDSVLTTQADCASFSQGSVMGYDSEGDYLYLVLDCDVTGKMLRLYQYFRSNASLYTKFNYGMDNYKPVDTLIVDDLLYTSWDTNNLTYIAWSADNISILNSSGDMLGVTSGNENGGHFYTTPYGDIGVIFDTDADGNKELYVAEFAQTASNTRLTTTAVNETLLSIYQDSDSTVYVYYKTDNNTVFQDTFCPSDSPISMGSTCSGFIGDWGDDTIYPAVTMVVQDDGACTPFPFSNEPLEAQCKLECLLCTKDLVRAKIWYNGQAVANYTCNVTREGTTYELNGSYDSSWDEVSQGWYGYEVPSAWRDKLVSVTCGIPNVEYSTVTIPFRVRNTYHDFVSVDASAYYGGTPLSIFYLNQTPIRLRETIYTNTESLDLIPAYKCFNTLDGFAEVEATPVTSYSYSDSCEVGMGYLCTYGMPYETNHSGLSTAGNYLQTYKCGMWGYVDNSTASRVPSVTVKKNIKFEDLCEGATESTTVFAYTTDGYTGNYTNNFSEGSTPYLFAGYRDSFDEVVEYSTCTATIYNKTSGTALVSHAMEREGAGTDYTNFKLCDTYYAIDSDTCSAELKPDDYNVTVTCTPQEASACLGTSSTTVDFSVEATTCAGTNSDCGRFGVCAACGTETLDCEGDINYTTPLACFKQSCLSVKYLGIDYDAPLGCEIYSIDFSMEDTGKVLICNDWDRKLEITLLKNSNPIGTNSIEDDVWCGWFIDDGQPSQMQDQLTYNPETRKFEGTIRDSYERNKPDCGRENTMRGICYSNSFFRPKTDSFSIAVTKYNMSCEDGTLQYMCVSKRTGDRADNPSYCGGIPDFPVLQENIDECGCASGFKEKFNNVTSERTCIPKDPFTPLFTSVGLFFWNNPLVLIIVFIIAILITRPKEVLSTINKYK